MRKAVSLCLAAGLLGLLSQVHAEAGVSGEEGASGFALSDGPGETLRACLDRYGLRYNEKVAAADIPYNDGFSGPGTRLPLNHARGTDYHGPMDWDSDEDIGDASVAGLDLEDSPKTQGKGLDFSVGFRLLDDGAVSGGLTSGADRESTFDFLPEGGILKALTSDQNLLQTLWEWSLPVTTFGFTYRY